MADVPPPSDPLSYIWYLLAQVTASIGDLTYNLQSALYSNINSITAQLSSVVGQLAAGIRALLGNLASTITQVVNGVLAGIQQYLGPLLETLSTIANQIQTFFSQILGRLQTVVLGLWQEITRRIGEALQWLGNLAVDIKNGVVAMVSQALDYVTSLYNQVKAAVVSLLDRAIRAVADVARKAVAMISQGIETLLAPAQDAIRETTDLINEGWQKLVRGSESLVEQIRERLKGITEGFGEAADVVAEAVRGMLPEQLPDLLSSVQALVDYIREGGGREAEDDITAKVQALVSPGTIDARTLDRAYAVFGSSVPKQGFMHVIFLLALVTGMMGGLFGGVTGACATAIGYDWSLTHPWRELEPSEIVTAYYRAVISRDEALTRLAKHGYDQRRAMDMITAYASHPAPQDVADWLFRGVIDRETAARYLRSAGLSDADVEHYLQAFEVLPSVQDLITMAVREVFSPEERTKLTLDADFPQQFALRAARVGVTEDTAKDYWAAHWRLPSAQQGYEMLHRGYISEDDLAGLLKALDFAPVWRPLLQQISYAPYTRVDIRRMHKVGILTRDQVKRSYLDLGYDEERAENLTAFTEALNQPAEEEETGILGRLRRTSILGFYRDGLLKRDRAAELLVEIGLSPEAADLFIQQVDVDEAEAERKEEAALVVERALINEITQQEARERLEGLGLGAAEVEKILAQLYRRIAAKTKIPSRSEGEQMLRAGIITPDVYKGLLGALGYTDTWAARFLALAQQKARA